MPVESTRTDTDLMKPVRMWAPVHPEFGISLYLMRKTKEAAIETACQHAGIQKSSFVADGYSVIEVVIMPCAGPGETCSNDIERASASKMKSYDKIARDATKEYERLARAADDMGGLKDDLLHEISIRNDVIEKLQAQVASLITATGESK